MSKETKFNRISVLVAALIATSGLLLIPYVTTTTHALVPTGLVVPCMMGFMTYPATFISCSSGITGSISSL